jgi:hypothetical protein
LSSAKMRFINEHDPQAPPAPGGGPLGFPHSIRTPIAAAIAGCVTSFPYIAKSF